MKLIIDTDPGNGIPGSDIDDGLAIGLALRSPEVELLALTVVAGNVPLDDGVSCALALLDAAGADVPVYRGAERPLSADPAPFRDFIDANRRDARVAELWAAVTRPPAVRKTEPTAAAEALVRLVRDDPGEVTLLTIGPLTNVAMAMALDPSFERNVARIVAMGGAFDVPHNLQELNFSYDPEAADRVLRSTADLLVVPLDATLQTTMRRADVDRLEAAGTPLARYLATTVRPWVHWIDERFQLDGCALHDPLAMATLLDPGVVGTRPARAAMELSGTLTRGRSIAWDAENRRLMSGPLILPDVRPIRIARAVDNDRFMPLLLDRLSR
jgi:inosine-uridine nucleoside N-ribohydrolase